MHAIIAFSTLALARREGRKSRHDQPFDGWRYRGNY